MLILNRFGFLGLTLGGHLDWRCHISKLSNGVSQCVGILHRLEQFLPVQTGVLVYSSLVLSHLDFGIILWGFKFEELFDLKKRIVGVLSMGKYNAHTDPLFKMLKQLKFNDIFGLQELRFCYRCGNNKLPCYLQSLSFHLDARARDHDATIVHRVHNPVGKHVFARDCSV